MFRSRIAKLTVAGFAAAAGLILLVSTAGAHQAKLFGREGLTLSTSTASSARESENDAAADAAAVAAEAQKEAAAKAAEAAKEKAAAAAEQATEAQDETGDVETETAVTGWRVHGIVPAITAPMHERSARQCDREPSAGIKCVDRCSACPMSRGSRRSPDSIGIICT